jgi:hypothetical protein
MTRIKVRLYLCHANPHIAPYDLLQDLDVFSVDDEKLCVSQKPAHTDEKPFHDKVRQLLDTASDTSRLAVMPSHWQPWL